MNNRFCGFAAFLLLLSFPALAPAQRHDLGQPPVPTGYVGGSKGAAVAVRPAYEPLGWIDTSNREAVRSAWFNDFLPTADVPIEWTGSHDTGDPGDTSRAYKEAVIQRVNFFRAMAGVPAWVQLNLEFSRKAQQAALMMSANKTLSHFPTEDWLFYTAEGAEAAKNSNLCIAYNSARDPGCIALYIEDSGDNNTAVGHRRWILYPQVREMGTGDVPQVGEFPYANVLWVFDSNLFNPRPATRDDFVAWPPPGYVPKDIVYDRWSFAYPEADLSQASVAMTRNGAPVDLTIEPYKEGFGENTIVWVPQSGVGNTAAGTGDVRTTVTVSNVIIGGQARQFTYEVIAFDPNAAVAANPVFSAAGLVNSASFKTGPIAPDAWADLFGENLATQFVIDGALPTSLDGSTLTIRDAAGRTHTARLHFVTTNRIQFLTPSGMAPGPATLTVTNKGGGSASTSIQVAMVAPGIFSANASGEGPAAATWLRVDPLGNRTDGFTFTLDAPPNRKNVPIDLGPSGDQIYLSFYGTGFRNQTSVSCTIGGEPVPVLGAVAQGQFLGLDQVVVGPLPRSLAGRGEVDVNCIFSGIPANTVTVAIK